MAKFKNVSPLGALDIPALNRIVEAGEVFEVPKDLLEFFAEQADNFKRVAAGSKPKEDEPEKSVVPPGDHDTDESEATR